MKAIHIQGGGEHAERLAEGLRRTGVEVTVGQEASAATKYVVTVLSGYPLVGEVMRAVRQARDWNAPVETPTLAVTVMPRQTAGPEEAEEPSPTMVSPAAQKIIQIDVTDACPRRCSNCTRLCGHRPAPYFMADDTFRRAVDSLQKFRGMVGVMGGEPTLHPRFAELSTYLAARRPDPPPGAEEYAPCEDWEGTHQQVLQWRPWRKGLWTGLGPGYRRHYELIQRVYRYQCVNDHRGGCRHTALLCARRDLGIPDAEWKQYRDACWLQRLWSATVTPRGAYFCEVAAALALTLGGPDGWPVEPEWWKRTPAEFGDQLEMCEYCSACLPVPSRVDADDTDQVTEGMARRLAAAGSKKSVEVVSVPWEELKARYTPGCSAEPYMEQADGRRVHRPSGLEVGEVTGVVVCKGYDDYLRLTLAHTCKELDTVLVVTAPEDWATQDLATRYGARVVLSEAIAGESFKKGTALAETLAKLPERSWVLLLDADIILPHGFGDMIRGMTLNPGALYYAERRGPPLDDWQAAEPVAELAVRHKQWSAVWEQIGTRVYSQSEPWGFFQLFHLGASVLGSRETRYPCRSASAEGDDDTFARVWYGHERCVRLPEPWGVVVHLPHGKARANWHGRSSPRLDDDWWWVDDPKLYWRIGYRVGDGFRGLWSLTQTVARMLPEGPIIEIGTMLGDGAAVLAAAFPERRIITVDHGPDPRVQAVAHQRTQLWHNIERWEMTSAQAAERVRAEGIRPAMVYLDGDHTEGGVRADIQAWRGLVAEGGVLAGHDYGEPAWPGVQRAVDGELRPPDVVFIDNSWLVTMGGK